MLSPCKKTGAFPPSLLKALPADEQEKLRRLARATLADVCNVSDEDLRRACDTLIEIGTPKEQAEARDLKCVIEGEAA